MCRNRELKNFIRGMLLETDMTAFLPYHNPTISL